MNIILPEVGEGIESVEITEICVKKGSTVKKDDVLLIVESEKASMEIPSESEGKVINILVNKGDTIKPGHTLIEIDASNSVESVDEKPEEPNDDISLDDSSKEEMDVEKEEVQKHSPPPQPAQPPLKNPSSSVVATPSVRKLARELGCDLENIPGSEKNNRITKEDVLNHVRSANQQNLNMETKIKDTEKVTPSIDEKQFLKFGNIEKASFNKIRSITAKRMHHSWSSIPHVTHFDEINVDHILNLKKEIELISNNKVSILSFIIKALTKTLSRMDTFNSSVDMANEVLIIKKYINLGVAVETPKGLLVPTIKNAEKKSLKQINSSILDLSVKARAGKLSPDELSGGTFTVSSLGGIGGKFFTPIINHPEVAIMGISKAYTNVELNKDNFPINRTILPFSLSYDHRVIDGAEAARFCNSFKETLSDLNNLE